MLSCPQMMKEKPSHVNPMQMGFREFTRGHLFHYLFFNNESKDPFGGLAKLHEEFLRKKKGGVIVEMHFSQVDPAWALNDVTERIGFRSIPATQPIASDRAPFYLPFVTRLAGINMVRVVSPDVKKRANVKNPDNKLVKGSGVAEYIRKAVNTVKKGGVVGTPPQATREPQLVQSNKDQAVVTNLIAGFLKEGVEDFAIHFVAFDMKGLNRKEDYESKKRRRYNMFKKHTTIHGNTYTLSELLTLAGIEFNPNDTQRQKAVKIFRSFENIESIVYHELESIVPQSYLPRPPAEDRKAQTLHESPRPNPGSATVRNEERLTKDIPIESIIAALARRYSDFGENRIAELVNKCYKEGGLNDHVSALVEGQIRNAIREEASHASLKQPPLS
jgi:hypothetical protein